jgi:hypothetical protein
MAATWAFLPAGYGAEATHSLPHLPRSTTHGRADRPLAISEQELLDRACFACMLGGEDCRPLFIWVAELQGLDRLDELFGSRTGRVLTAPAPTPGAGWP